MKSLYLNQSPDQILNQWQNYNQIRLGRVIAIYPRTGTVKVRLLNSAYHLDYFRHSDSIGEIHAFVVQPTLSWDGHPNDRKGYGNWLATKKKWLAGRVRFPRKGDYVVVGFLNGTTLSPIVLGSLPFIPTTGYPNNLPWWKDKAKGKRSNYSVLDYPPNIEQYEQDYGESYDRWLDVHPSQVYTKIDWKAQSTSNSFQYEWSHPFGKADDDRIYDGNKFMISTGDDNEDPTKEDEIELLTERFRWEDYDSDRHPDPAFIKFTWVDRLKPPWIKLKLLIKKTTDFFISRVNSIINDYLYLMVSGEHNHLHIERKHSDDIHKVVIYIQGESTDVEVYRYNGEKYHYFLMKDNEIYLKHENNQYIKMIDEDIIIDTLPPNGDIYLKGRNVYVSATNSFDTTSTPNAWIRNDVHTPDDADTGGYTYL